MATPDRTSLEDRPEADIDDNAPIEYRVMARSKTDDVTRVVMITTSLEAARRRTVRDPSKASMDLWIEQRRNLPWSKREE